VATLGTWEASFDGDATELADAVRQVWREELVPCDPSGLLAESNVDHYRPLDRALIRAGAGVSNSDVALARTAAGALGVPVTVSSPVERPHLAAALTAKLLLGTTTPETSVADSSAVTDSSAVALTSEDDDTFVQHLHRLGIDKLRILGE